MIAETRSAGALPAEALSGVEPPLPAGAVEKLTRLFGLLREWRGAGITGFRSPEGLARHYFREALLLRALLPARGACLDVGSGGGTPALPLAIALDASRWTLLEPRRAAAGFLELAADRLGVASRVRVIRHRLGNYLGFEEGRSTVAAVSAVTLRAVRLRPAEWRGLAAALPADAAVIWPTSAAARNRAALPIGLYEEKLLPAERGIVWMGQPRRTDP